ncbi:MAG: hypothetical protein ACE15C_13760 [Phycisphaerae bacterium]
MKAMMTVLLEPVVGFAFAVVGAFAGFAVFAHLEVGNCKTPALFGFTIGAPLACAVSICVVDGLISGFRRRFTILGLLLAFLIFATGVYGALMAGLIDGNAKLLILGMALALLSAMAYRWFASRKGTKKRMEG